MALNSEIAWTHHTGNLWWGCTEVHEGCDHCYAKTLANRWGTQWGNNTPRRKLKNALGQFQGMQYKAAALGEVHRVFVGSMMDIFEKPMPMIDHQGNALPYDTDHLRQRFFAEIVPNCPNLMFLLLTKRPSNINKYIPESWKANPPQNVMFGASVVNEKTARDVHRQSFRSTASASIPWSRSWISSTSTTGIWKGFTGLYRAGRAAPVAGRSTPSGRGIPVLLARCGACPTFLSRWIRCSRYRRI